MYQKKPWFYEMNLFLLNSWFYPLLQSSFPHFCYILHSIWWLGMGMARRRPTSPSHGQEAASQALASRLQSASQARQRAAAPADMYILRTKGSSLGNYRYLI